MGGVSLAVWMGGVVLELDRLTRGEGPYADLLDMVGSTARELESLSDRERA